MARELALSPSRELRIFANTRATATSTDFTLPAGKRQRVSNFGIYGYAMGSSATLGDALKLCFRHLPLDGPVLEISILERLLPNTLMLLPYAPPKHWRECECLFRCHVLFGQDAMEWHFDIAVMDQPCPSANSTAAQTCRSLCERILQLRVGETSLAGISAPAASPPLLRFRPRPGWRGKGVKSTSNGEVRAPAERNFALSDNG